MKEGISGSGRGDARTFGLGLLIGAALGAGAALMLAPDKGRHTRRRLRRGAEHLYERGSEGLAELVEDTDRSARRLARRGMARSRKFADQARERVGL